MEETLEQTTMNLSDEEKTVLFSQMLSIMQKEAETKLVNTTDYICSFNREGHPIHLMKQATLELFKEKTIALFFIQEFKNLTLEELEEKLVVFKTTSIPNKVYYTTRGADLLSHFMKSLIDAYPKLGSNLIYTFTQLCLAYNISFLEDIVFKYQQILQLETKEQKIEFLENDILKPKNINFDSFIKNLYEGFNTYLLRVTNNETVNKTEEDLMVIEDCVQEANNYLKNINKMVFTTLKDIEDLKQLNSKDVFLNIPEEYREKLYEQWINILEKVETYPLEQRSEFLILEISEMACISMSAYIVELEFLRQAYEDFFKNTNYFVELKQ